MAVRVEGFKVLGSGGQCLRAASPIKPSFTTNLKPVGEGTVLG